jgi:hypothetical protein
MFFFKDNCHAMCIEVALHHDKCYKTILFWSSNLSLIIAIYLERHPFVSVGISNIFLSTVIFSDATITEKFSFKEMSRTYQ